MINIFALSVVFPVTILAQGNVRIMVYNLKEYKSESGRTSNFVNIISGINPDILVAVELNDESPGDAQTHANYFLTNVMNSIGTYSLEILTTSIDDENAIYYKTELFDFLSVSQVNPIPTGTPNHPTLEFKLKHKFTAQEIIIYGVHFSSNTATQRNYEASGIRALTDNFTNGENYIAAGDFNLSGNSEEAYDNLVNNTPEIFLDPRSFEDDFIKSYNIQGTFDKTYDFILNSPSVGVTGGMVEYVDGSFTVFGNTDGSPPAVGSDLVIASDHLPVYADYIFESPSPVELAYFAGTLNDNSVELRWRTETEVNNYGFYIERATKDSNWLALGFVEGHGNSNSPKHYNFMDSDIYESANYYYRLKQTDNDGTFEYSDVVTVTVGVPVLYSLSQNYPNPFNPETRIDYTLSEQQYVSLRVYNMLGELVQELVNDVKPAGTYTVTFNPSSVRSGLPSGIYVYVLKTPAFVSNRKMTFLK